MGNSLYQEFLKQLYENFPQPVKSLVDNFGPYQLFKEIESYIRPFIENVPYLGSLYRPIANLFKGAVYLPYSLLLIGLIAPLGYGKSEMACNEKKLGSYLSTTIMAPLVEEIIFRYVPSVIGKFIGGSTGEIYSVVGVSILWGLLHLLDKKEIKKGDVIERTMDGLLSSHIFLKHGFLASLGLHISRNFVGTTLFKLLKLVEKYDKD